MSNRTFHIQNGQGLRLIVFTGESNSGGYALNSDATGGELGVRNSIQLWDNVGMTSFTPLNIGVNNLLGHTGFTLLETTTRHGWELGLANIYDKLGMAYVVKTGQGGSVLTDWGTAGAYYTTMKARINGAKSVQNFKSIVFFYTHGVNDRIAGTSTGTFKTRVQTHIANIKADYPGAKFVMLKNMTNNGNDVYNTVIQEIDDADSDLVSVACSTLVQGDGNHYTYAGQKENAQNLYNAMISNGW